MQTALRGGREIIEREVAIGHAVEAVRRGASETKRVRRRSRSIAKPVPASAALPSGHSFIRTRASTKRESVAAQHLVIRHQMVAERHRLRDLQVGEARHDRFGMLFCALHQNTLKRADHVHRLFAGIAHPQPEVSRDLVVARARRVQPSCRRADELAEPTLDGHVDVFEFEPLGNAVALIFGGDLVQPFEDCSSIGFGDDPLVAQASPHAPSRPQYPPATAACRSRSTR